MEADTDPETFSIIGAAMETHRTLGPGFLEAVYHEALSIELASRQIPFQKQVALAIWYKGCRLSSFFRADFVCYNSVIVELKALSRIGNVERAQVINYLKGSGLQRGLLINFGAASLQYKRLILSSPQPLSRRFSSSSQ
jgi:GxxExxY protein